MRGQELLPSSRLLVVVLWNDRCRGFDARPGQLLHCLLALCKDGP